MSMSEQVDLLSEVRNAWGWVGIEPVGAVEENEFGNLILEDSEGKYWRLCPEDIYCKVVANTKHELEKLFRDPDFRADWAMTALVEQAVESVGPLRAGWKYCLAVPGVFGGAYARSNIRSVPLPELIRFSGSIGQKLRDLPDGTQIELKLGDDGASRGKRQR